MAPAISRYSPAIRRASALVSSFGCGSSAWFILKYWRLAPFPFAGVPIVTGDAALDHFAAPLVARHDEGGQVAEAKAKYGERRHDDELQPLTHCTSSGIRDIDRNPSRLV